MAYVYQHIRLDTDEVFYIGIGSDTDGKYERANRKKGRNRYWKHIVNKIGYRVEILTDSISWETACKEEIRLIKHYGRKDLNEGNLVNLTDGGDGAKGIIFSDEHRRKLSEINKGNTYAKGNQHKKINPRSKEHIEKLRKANIGKILSEETKQKIRESQILHYKIHKSSDTLDK